MSIYKTFEIYGDAVTELNPQLYRSWGLALGLKLEPRAKFVVGGDIRESTPEFLSALVEGLCQAGLDVVNLGQLPTPMIYHARHRVRAEGCAIVTASHESANINGLKWMINDRPPTPDDVQALQTAVDESAPKSPSGRAHSESRTLDVSFDYVANLQETWVDALGAQLHLVLDPMHGCWAGKARRYLHAIFPQCLISAINDEPDAAFAGRAPDCSHPKTLHDLSDAVYRERAHLGVAFDGDGDCLAVVDDQGAALTAEETAWVLMETLGKALRKERFVYDLKFSDRVPERAKKLGAEAIVERSGHGAIRYRMSETNALFGAESNGHYFFRALEGGDDGLYAACRIIAFLAQSGRSLSQWRRKCPAVYITPDLHLSVPQEAQARIMDKIRVHWAAFPQRSIEGLRIDTPAGWILVCPSAAEPALTFRFESIDWHGLNHLVKRFCDTLSDLGEKLWNNYITAMGMAGNNSAV